MAKEGKDKQTKGRFLRPFTFSANVGEYGDDERSDDSLPARPQKSSGAAKRSGGAAAGQPKRKKQTSAMGKAAATSKKEVAALDEEEDEEGGGEGDQEKKKGAPSKDIIHFMGKLWKDFASAGNNSSFFGEKGNVQRRTLQRWEVKIKQKITKSASDDDKLQSYEVALKKCQIMESMVGLARSWQFKGSNVAKAMDDFNKEWIESEIFAGAEPTVIVKCDFMWNVRLTNMVPGPMLYKASFGSSLI